jgi:uncharacterized protein YbjT (DUF2867 family)
MKIILTGGTGLVGGEVLREALSDDEIEQITVLTRKPLVVENDKIKSLIIENFLDYSAISDEIKDHDACIWCLGLSQKGVSAEEYEKVTHDYTLAAARAMAAANPDSTFCFLSGMGADSTEKSRVLFAKIKGKTENSLNRLGLKVYNFRPGYIHPVRGREKPRLEEKMLKPFVPLYRRIAPSYMIDSDDLARVLIEVAKNGYDHSMLEGKDIRKVANSLKT